MHLYPTPQHVVLTRMHRDGERSKTWPDGHGLSRILRLILGSASWGFDMLGIFILMVGSLLLLMFVATQGSSAWLGVPYEVAWIAVGYLLFLSRSGQFRAAPRVR